MHEPHSRGVRRITHFVRVEVVMHHYELAQPALPAGNLSQGDTSELHDQPPGAGRSAAGNCGREGEA